MASISKPILDIQPSQPIGKFAATVTWDVSWDGYDLATGQPYQVDVKVFGDDTVQGDVQSSADDFIAPTKTYVLKPGDPTVRTDTFAGIDYTLLNEDNQQNPMDPNSNPDEIRASVKLTPIYPMVVGPVESDVTALQLT